MSELDKSSIEKLKKKLYSQNTESKIIDSRSDDMLRTQSRRESINQWGEEKVSNESDRVEHARAYRPKAARFFKLLFSFSILFCVIAAAVAVFIFFGNYNQISADNIDITVLGPVSIGGGENLSLLVTLENKNRANLTMTHLKISYPDGTYAVDDTSKLLPRDNRFLDVVQAGSQKQTKFEAVLFGEENVTKNFIITVEYQIPGSATLYTKEKQYSILLTKAPISLLIDYDKSVTSDQQVSFTLTAISNSRAKIDAVTLNAAYPLGWKYSDSDPLPISSGKDAWRLGSFMSGERKTITIKGVVSGQNADEKVFRFTLGSPQKQDETQLVTTFVQTVATMSLEKPFLSTKLSLGNENKNGEVVGNLGQEFFGALEIRNNLPVDLIDITVQVMPKGNLYDRYSVGTDNGYYKSVENIIFWDRTIKSDLATLSPGRTSQMNFNFTSLSPEGLTQLVRNPQMSVDVIVTGKSITDTEGTKDVKVAFTKNIKFSTSASLAAQTLYGVGVFKNTGPVPPRAEQKTTYTIQFELKNTYNHVSDSVLTAQLPFDVQWIPRASSTLDNITFDPTSRTVRWNIGELMAFTGYNSTSRIGTFQVSIFPSTAGVGGTPVLVTGINMTGVDRFTGNVIKLSSPRLTARLIERGDGSGIVGR